MIRGRSLDPRHKEMAEIDDGGDPQMVGRTKWLSRLTSHADIEIVNELLHCLLSLLYVILRREKVIKIRRL